MSQQSSEHVAEVFWETQVREQYLGHLVMQGILTALQAYEAIGLYYKTS